MEERAYFTVEFSTKNALLMRFDALSVAISERRDETSALEFLNSSIMFSTLMVTSSAFTLLNKK